MSVIDIIANILAFYLPVIIGGISQIVIIILPVHFSNWDDDMLNVLTYISVQVFIACFVFVGVPVYFEIFSIGSGRAAAILLMVFFAAAVRAYKVIPLEFASPVTASYSAPNIIEFSDFINPIRLRSLSEISQNDTDGITRFALLRERLQRQNPERYSSKT